MAHSVYKRAAKPDEIHVIHPTAFNAMRVLRRMAQPLCEPVMGANVKITKLPAARARGVTKPAMYAGRGAGTMLGMRDYSAVKSRLNKGV
jgi:hypothetical protein